MKFGLRTPSIKRSISARTTGKIKRNVKKTINPLSGKKGMGYINNPEKALYNKVYSRTTVGVKDVVNGYSNISKTTLHNNTYNSQTPHINPNTSSFPTSDINYLDNEINRICPKCNNTTINNIYCPYCNCKTIGFNRHALLKKEQIRKVKKENDKIILAVIFAILIPLMILSVILFIAKFYLPACITLIISLIGFVFSYFNLKDYV